MCGIAGIITLNKDHLVKIKEMTDIIAHRGPDMEGFYTENTFAFGHRRLSIIDLSENGKQPMLYENNYVITYNGEIYNYLELKAELQKYGYAFHSKTDTEVIMAAYDRWGQECVMHFNGMWSFAIYSKKDNSIFCSRDRFGIKPFYYTFIKDSFIFASEIKQFTIFEEWKSELNTNIAIHYLLHGWVDYNKETFFKNVYQLRGGHNVVYNLSLNTYKIAKWYNLHRAKNINNESFNNAKNKFKQFFSDSVKLRLRADVKIGSCLSGGIDSSSIVCEMNRLLKLKNIENIGDIQETVSACFDIDEFDERKYIDEVIKTTQIKPNKVFPKYENLFSNLNKIIWHLDEPFGSSSIFAQWNVFKKAKEQNIKVMLDGQGADEYLAGYQTFFNTYFAFLILTRSFSKLISEIRFYKKKHCRKYKLSKAILYLVAASLPTNLRLILRNYLHINHPRWLKVKMKTDFNFPIGIRDLSLEQILHNGLPSLLKYEDRNSMAFSIESRVPFLDYRLVEYTSQLPPHFLINKAETKHILRQALSDILPEKIIKRYDKMGFVTPEQNWIKENPSVYKEKVFQAGQALKHIVHINDLMKQFDKDINNLGMGSVYWRLICLHHWINVFKVKL